MPVSPQAFKQALAQWASGVTVVTTVFNGQRLGLTVSSFSSVSLNPPLISVCLDKKLYTCTAIEQSGAFAVNVLDMNQMEYGLVFAGMKPGVEDRFEGIAINTAVTDSPILPGVLCWLDCKVWQVYDGGDHVIFVGEVLATDSSGADTPLLYHNRLWRRSESLDVPTLSHEAHIIEVGPRDGWQAEATLIPTTTKVEMIDALSQSGLRRIQVASFVHPQKVPQMADAEDVCARIQRQPGVIYSGLALNSKGVERAAAADLQQVDISVSASEAHNQKNIGKSVEDGLLDLEEMVRAARAKGLSVRAGVQCAFGSVEEGAIEPRKVIGMVRRILALGVDELLLADSTGMANPQAVRRLVQELRPMVKPVPLVLHLHDTRGMGLANVLSAMRSGVNYFDTAFGGLGGCPFIPGATGNIATEDTVNMLEAMGVKTGVNVAQVAAVSQKMESLLGRQLDGKVYKLAGG
ncbi:MAG: hydroxymethylglutaryl-CoA lyase [Anaerolineales bacterium]|nr:hydroxymethylglutaryl-CoA lyase [Anaerolineales bacterium]